MARMIVADREYVTSKYKLHKLKEVSLIRPREMEIFPNSFADRESCR